MISAFYHKMLNIVNKLFGSSSDRIVKKYSSLVEKINKLENDISNLSDQESLAVVTKTIQTGRFGEIKFKGTFYKAKCDDGNIEIKAGESVTVIKQGDEQGSYYLVNK